MSIALPSPLLADEAHERFTLGESIGLGGLGVVHDAVDNETGQPVAVKLAKTEDERVKPNRTVATFRAEAELLHACRGRHVMGLVAHGMWDEHWPMLAVERCVGTVYDLAKDRALPLARALGITAEVLVALDAVHAAGVIHRDIKPSNVFIGRDGGVRLGDFNVAWCSFNPTAAKRRGVGTPQFSAPVQEGVQPERWHDFYSLGLVLLALSTHLKPRALTDPVERGRTLRLFPQATAVLLARSTARGEGNYSSAAEMGSAVLRALAEL